MTSSILVTATQRGSGKSLVALGLVNELESVLGRVGYFKPVGNPGSEGVDPDVRLMKSALGLDLSLEEMAPVTMEEVSESLSRGRYDELLDRILEAYERAAEGYEFMVCEGTDYFGAMAAFEFNLNADLSNTLGAPIVLVANACEGWRNGNGQKECSHTCETVASHVGLVKESADERHAEMFGVILNRASPSHVDEVRQMIQRDLEPLGVKLLGIVPRSDVLSRIRMEEVAAALGAEVISGHDRLSNVVQETVVAAMTVENVLERLPKGALVVVPGDRDDLALALAAAYVSPAAPRPAGVVMTGGLMPGINVRRLFVDVTNGQMPVLKVGIGTYEAAVAVSEIRPSLHAHQRMRLEVVKGLIERHVDVEPLMARAAVDPSGGRRVTPKQFIHRFVQKARADRRRVVLPEGKEARILRAASIVAERGIADLTILGDEDEVRFVAAHAGVRLPQQVEVVDPRTSEHREGFARRYIELRSPKKNPTWEMSFDLMQDSTYFGTMMVHEGMADGMVSGAATTTAATLRPALEFIKTKEGFSIASSVFFMCLPDSVVVYGDCAVNPDPTAEQLADIALASAETARAFGVEPYVAMLSYSTGSSGQGSAVDKVRQATELVRERMPSLPIEGPIQYDAAIDPDVAKTKLPGSRVAGSATVFVFPDLDSGNNTYKAVQRAAKAIAIGPVMQGLRMPVNDLSRGCTVPDIVNTVAITAVQAQRN